MGYRERNIFSEALKSVSFLLRKVVPRRAEPDPVTLPKVVPRHSEPDPVTGGSAPNRSLHVTGPDLPWPVVVTRDP